MSTATKPRTDHQLQQAIESELEWTPDVDAADIGVSVEDGAVTLSGELDDYAERIAAKRAATRVRGVTAVVDNMTVRSQDSTWAVSDTDIGKAVVSALKASSTVPDTVKAEIKAGVVILTGRVQWDFQRNAARRAVEHLRGVVSVDSRITLSPRASSKDTAHLIKEALVRNASVDADRVTVIADGTVVTLTGTVTSWSERNQAGYAAWSSPHVTEVHNLITVAGI
jgi:osmotically-inducible protein OsmY